MDIPGDMSTQAMLPLGSAGISCSIASGSDSDWYRVQLVKDQPYAVRLYVENDYYRVAVRDQTGKVLTANEGDIDNQAGVQIRAPYTGLFFVEARGLPGPHSADDYCNIAMAKDCAQDLKTQCGTSVGGTFKGDLFSDDDIDYIRVGLSKNKKYDIRIFYPYQDGGDEKLIRLRLLSPQGNVLRYCGAHASGDVEKCTLTNFTAGTTADYFIEVSPGFRGGSYNVKVIPK